MYRAHKEHSQSADDNVKLADDTERESDERDSDEEDDDPDRSGRFVEFGENSELFKDKTMNELKPFYNGTVLDKRMKEIRKSINYIRQHWDEYDEFLADLKILMNEGGRGMNFKDGRTRMLADTLLSSKRDWLTTDQAEKQDVSYEAIRLYTSKEGYAKIYRVANDIFRTDDSVATVRMIRSVVFLVELINIDLFNYCLKCPQQTNFEGVVYRGLCVTEEELGAFLSLGNIPVNRRNIAIPLGLQSASSSLEKARTFIKQHLKRKSPNDKPLHPLVLKIHVIGLKPEYVQRYTTSFPSTLLTTICAVDIHKISCHKNEREVLLRGPFLVALDMRTDEHDVMGQSCHVIEVVMLNANRDHISTSLLGDLEAPARNMFAAMVAVTRCEFAMKYCLDNGLHEDAETYQRMLEENRLRLESMAK